MPGKHKLLNILFSYAISYSYITKQYLIHNIGLICRFTTITLRVYANNMNEALAASSPDQNAVVMASAGTGKTWLLVTRLLRLLMAGVKPDTIIAITFTRKAAAEMQSRLFDRLFEFLTLDDEILAATLERLGIPASGESPVRARCLYEILLRNEQPIRITTFHAFCHEILKRFPLEADVPPGFELLENSGLLEQEAYDALFNEATAKPDGELAQALDALLTHFGGTFALRSALNEFMQHRSDWWAFTYPHDHAVMYACAQLATQLNIDPAQNPCHDFLNDNITDLLLEFVPLLNKHATQTNQKHVVSITRALDPGHTVEHRIGLIKNAFLTKEGMPLARKQNKAQAKAMGDEGESRFLDIHHLICDLLAELLDRERRLSTYTISKAWYTAGDKLLDHYQRIKLEQRQLDFTDLELKAYRLLNHSNNALWVQYKLDQRIDHLLIDEFQDTNPTQWRMMLPLLNELAAGHHDHKRSVFLVGDSKQSIYRFRRADPHLIDTAYSWLERHLDTRQYPLDISWRSSPAIIRFINKVFEKGPLRERLPAFHTHDTHLHDLWGIVEVMPLVRFSRTETSITPDELRNPLDNPRVIDEDVRHYQEGQVIGRRIRGLIDNNTLINSEPGTRPLTYNDIILLVRNRTHMSSYEKALREAHIPYQSTGKTTLLDSLEIQDIVALLDTLITPYNNLSLAAVLRSPVFDCSDDDLMLVASCVKDRRHSGHVMPWIERIASLAPSLDDGAALKRAHYWLSKWRSLAGQLPVHDLLDRIYSEGNVVERYQAAFPPHLQQRVQANLDRFMELALEIDSGRYPSLVLFLSRLRSLRQHAQDMLDEPPPLTENSVRIMTIHAAKGLEAAAVFLANSASSHTRTSPCRAVINWPSDTGKPVSYFVTGKKSGMDTWSRSLIDKSEQEELQEEVNLLYVALTRAKQLLFVSGCAPNKGGNLGWYGMITANLMDNTPHVQDTGYLLESGHPPPQPVTGSRTDTKQTIAIDPRLSQPLPQAIGAQSLDISPSHKILNAQQSSYKGNDGDGSLRGNVMHRILALLTAKKAMVERSLIQHVAHEFALETEYPELKEWLQEAMRLIHHPSLQEFFDPACFSSAHNEVPIQYSVNGRPVYGIIDRLIINNDNIIVIDYKTQRHATIKNIVKLAAPYHHQIQLYRQGIEKLWPEKPVRSILLFTACAEVVEMNGQMDRQDIPN